MTREEAIKNIKEHCYFANLIPQAKEALDMAIEALKQNEELCDQLDAVEEENEQLREQIDELNEWIFDLMGDE